MHLGAWVTYSLVAIQSKHTWKSVHLDNLSLIEFFPNIDNQTINLCCQKKMQCSKMIIPSIFNKQSHIITT